MHSAAHLLGLGLHWETVEEIINAPWAAKHLLFLGRPENVEEMKKIVRVFFNDSYPCAFNGTTPTRKVADLYDHDLTQKNLPWYTIGDSAFVVREAREGLRTMRRELRQKRLELSKSGQRLKYIPPPGSMTGKQDTKVEEPGVKSLHGPSRLSQEVKFESKTDYDEMEEYFEGLCEFEETNTVIDASNDNVHTDVSDHEPDGSESDVSEEEPEGQEKPKRESRISPKQPIFNLPVDIDHDGKRRKLKHRIFP